jgi:hypothetical protein
MLLKIRDKISKEYSVKSKKYDRAANPSPRLSVALYGRFADYGGWAWAIHLATWQFLGILPVSI